MRFVRKELLLQLASTLLLAALIFGAVRIILAENPGADGSSRSSTRPTINGRPLVNLTSDNGPNENSGYQTIDGRPLRQTVGGTAPPQPGVWERMGTGTKNFFGKIGNWFAKPDDKPANNGLVRPATAATNQDLNAAEKININGSQIPIGYGPDGRNDKGCFSTEIQSRRNEDFYVYFNSRQATTAPDGMVVARANHA
jgi:hypothetical protein